MREPRRQSLFRHADFMKLWSGQTVSQFGAQVSLLAIPLAAVLVLHAGAEQMGLLSAFEMAPFLVFGLFIGVYVDRVRRRPLLIAADIGRAVLMGLIPAAAAFHMLSIGLLYAVGFLAGGLTVLFDVAYQSYLPSLITRDALIDGNSKLEISRAMSQVSGKAIAGFLVQWLTAPGAVLANALSYVVSVLSLLAIHSDEVPPARVPGRRVVADVREGLAIVLKHPLLRSIAFCTATSNFFGNMSFAVYVLFAVRQLGVSAAELGLVYAAGSVGALAVAMATASLGSRFGPGRVIVAGIFISSLGNVVVALAMRPPLLGLSMLILAQLLGAIGGTAYNITQVSLRQAIVPSRLLGRMNASMRFVVWGCIPLGALAGGALGTALGLRAALAVGAAGGLLSVLWVWFSPVRALNIQPTSVEEAFG